MTFRCRVRYRNIRIDREELPVSIRHPLTTLDSQRPDGSAASISHVSSDAFALRLNSCSGSAGHIAASSVVFASQADLFVYHAHVAVQLPRSLAVPWSFHRRYRLVSSTAGTECRFHRTRSIPMIPFIVKSPESLFYQILWASCPVLVFLTSHIPHFRPGG